MRKNYCEKSFRKEGSIFKNILFKRRGPKEEKGARIEIQPVLISNIL
jgi:hypothetical protein